MINLFTLATAVAEEATTTTTTTSSSSFLEILISLLPMVLIFVVFYFMLIRPQQKKDKEAKKMLDELKVTDRICTIGGIYGTITSIKDDVLTIAVGRANTEMVIARWAVRSVEDKTAENEGELN